MHTSVSWDECRASSSIYIVYMHVCSIMFHMSHTYSAPPPSHICSLYAIHPPYIHVHLCLSPRLGFILLRTGTHGNQCASYELIRCRCIFLSAIAQVRVARVRLYVSFVVLMCLAFCVVYSFCPLCSQLSLPSQPLTPMHPSNALRRYRVVRDIPPPSLHHGSYPRGSC